MTLTTAYQARAKTCHGRTERREMWVLADAELAAYAGSAGTVGKPWPHLQQLCWFRRERTVKGVIHGLTTRLQLRNRSHAVAFALRNELI